MIAGASLYFSALPCPFILRLLVWWSSSPSSPVPAAAHAAVPEGGVANHATSQSIKAPPIERRRRSIYHPPNPIRCVVLEWRRGSTKTRNTRGFKGPPCAPIPLPASSGLLRPGAGGGGDSVRSLPLVVCTRSSVCTRPVRRHPRRFIPRWCLETATVLANRQSLCGVDRSMDLNHPGRRMCRRTEKIIPPRQPPATQQRHAPRRGPGRGVPAGSGGGGAMDARTASKLIATG